MRKITRRHFLVCLSKGIGWVVVTVLVMRPLQYFFGKKKGPDNTLARHPADYHRQLAG